MSTSWGTLTRGVSKPTYLPTYHEEVAADIT
jgi:hypothetical protein